jgi:hypothetical protein
MALELLGSIVGRIHDFCGSLEEDNLRTNFVLIYELIDEIIVSINDKELTLSRTSGTHSSRTLSSSETT